MSINNHDKILMDELKKKFTFEGDNGKDTIHMLFCNHGEYKSIAKLEDIESFLRAALEAQEARHNEAVSGIKQLIIEDVPHKYQDRLFKHLAEKEGVI